MAVASTLVPLGTPAPRFSLPALDGSTVRLADLDDRPVLVVAFVCNHCPYVRHIERALGEWYDSVEGTGVALVAITSNDVAAYPDDDLPGRVEQAARAGWRFPYLYDESQQVARAFGAACTPDLFVYGPERTLAYRGAFDASTPGNDEPVDGGLLRDAVALVLAGRPVPEPHRASMGCSLKWKPDSD